MTLLLITKGNTLPTIKEIRVKLDTNGKTGNVMYPGYINPQAVNIVWFKFSIIGTEFGLQIQDDQSFTGIMKHVVRKIESDVIEVFKRNLMNHVVDSVSHETEIVIRCNS